MDRIAFSLARFVAAARMELRALVWHWTYPLLHIGWAALLAYLFFGRDDRTAQALLETIVGHVAIGLLSLVALFIAGISATRAQRAKLAELEATFPTDVEVPLGRYLAGVCAMAPFLIEPLAVAALQGPTGSLLRALPVFVGEALLTVAFTMAATWWLSSWLTLGRWAYPLLAAGWLGFMIGPATLADSYPWMTLFDFMRQASGPYYELWGRLVYDDLPRWFNLFYLGMALLFLGLTIMHHWSRRHNRTSPRLVLPVLMALLLVGFGGGRYASDVMAARDGGAALAAGSSPAVAPQEGLAAEAYDLTLDLGDATGQTHFLARLTVVNRGEAPISELAFILDAGLAVSDVSLPFTRTGQQILVQPAEPLRPGESMEVEFAYAGEVWRVEWNDGIPTGADFIRPEGIRLTDMAAWYPRPAGELLGAGDMARIARPPARMHLRVANSGDLPLASNLPMVAPGEFEAEAATWIFLIGSPDLVVEPIGRATLITARHDLPRVRELVPLYTDCLAGIEPFFPHLDLDDLTLMILGEEPGLPEGTPPVDGRPVVVLSRAVMAGLEMYEAHQRHMVDYALVCDLWTIGSGETIYGREYLARAISDFLWLHRRHDGDEGQMLSALRQWESSLPPEHQGRSVTQVLVEIYGRDGRMGVAGAISLIQAHGEELRVLPSEEVSAWLQEAYHGQ